VNEAGLFPGLTLIWFAKKGGDRTPWLIRDSGGETHLAAWFRAFGPCTPAYNPEGFRELEEGPKAILKCEGATLFGTGEEPPLKKPEPDGR